MNKDTKKNGIDTTLFIVASLAAFVIFIALYLVIINLTSPTASPVSLSSDKYYLNKSFKMGDPLITRQPSLRDMLAGPIVSENDPGFGRSDAPVTIVIFSDFECTYCYEQEKELREAISGRLDDVRFIWKDYPEATSINSESYQAAVAARCANEQDMFWEYSALLFENNQNLHSDTYPRLARELDLDINAFELCRQSDEVKTLINDNILEANALGINGVPFVYINDQEIMGRSNAKDLLRLIDIELSRNTE